MGCLLALLALISPRLVLFLLWIFSNVLSRAFDSWIIPLLGFFLLPWTTLVYALAWDANPHHLTVFEWLLLYIVGFANCAHQHLSNRFILGLIYGCIRGNWLGIRF